MHPFIHVHGPLYPLYMYMAPASIYTCTWPPPASIYTCTWPPCSIIHVHDPSVSIIHVHGPSTHLYTYMPLHPFIHIHAPAPIYAHTSPLSFDNLYLLSHPPGFIFVPPSAMLLLKYYQLMILASSLCISITPCMLALLFIWLFNQSLPPCKIMSMRTDTTLRVA